MASPAFERPAVRFAAAEPRGKLSAEIDRAPRRLRNTGARPVFVRTGGALS